MRSPASIPHRSPCRPRRQQGIVLVVALIVLIVMALVGLGMMRQATTGVSIAGNVAFRQNALSAGDFGTNSGLNFLQTTFQTNASSLNGDMAPSYYATWGANTNGDPIQLFQNAAPPPAIMDSLGNTVQYIVERLCAVPGPSNAIGQQCSVNDQAASNSTKGGTPANYGTAGNTDVPPPLYRISAKVIGPKNSTAYTQVIVE